ncbi:MAG TPA: trypsin-like peptidase domain-containing protein [Chthoniobacterales bacterium]|nr:trypsin-like peptidase domain-containing protein [Chthoniobacterales bacterium]
MKRTRVVATALGRGVGASTKGGRYSVPFAIVLLVAMQSAFAQTPTPLPSASPTDPASEPAVLAVAKVMPAVVNINAESVVRRQVRDPFEDFAAEFFGTYRSQPREIRQRLQSLGSGFIVDPAGYIVTNEHVVQRAADLRIEVTTSDGKVYNARYITGDPKKDLAFIKIEGKSGFPFIDLNNLSPNLLGETVIVVGNSVGYGSSISRGVLSGLKREITVGDIEYKDLVQTDAAINPGNSGGPVVDIAGRLVGISSAKMAFTPQGVPTQGLGFAIPADTVREAVKGFKAVAQKKPSPEASPGSNQPAVANADRLFGMQLQDLTAELTDAFGLLRGRGVLVSAVEPGSPAAEIGIERGLVIYRLGRRDVNSVKSVENLLARVQSGMTVDFTVGLARSDGERQIQTVSLTAR